MSKVFDHEHEARAILPSLFADWLDGAAPMLEPRPTMSGGADFVIRLPHGERMLAEVKTSNRTVDVEAAARRIVAAASEAGAWPLLVVPFMGSAGARAARAAGANWVDLSGNAHIELPGSVWVHVEGRPNAYPERGRPSTPFAPASARISRLMLIDWPRWWRQVELAQRTGLARGQVSKVVRRLDELELLERDRDDDVRFRPADPRRLLDAWAEDHDFAALDRIRGHVTGDGPRVTREVAASLADAGVEYAVTGLSGAWLLDRFAQYRLSSVYVGDALRDVAQRLELRVGDRGANVELVAPRDRGVFHGAAMVDEIHTVHPVQIYLDLLGLPERAAEAAEYLRAEHLSFEPAS